MRGRLPCGAREKRWGRVEEVDIEGVLGDVDADEGGDGVHVEEIPDLRRRARSPGARSALTAVRAGITRPLPISLRDGLLVPRRDRSDSGRPGQACCAARSMRVSPLHSVSARARTI